MTDAQLAELFASIDAGRLVLICGAGLSMGEPSRTPGARELADDCVQRYQPEAVPPEIQHNLEQLADFPSFESDLPGSARGLVAIQWSAEQRACSGRGFSGLRCRYSCDNHKLRYAGRRGFKATG